MAGLYIVIEGSDGTGKTSQAKLLQKHLESKGLETLLVEEPGGTTMAEQIRGLLKDKNLPRHFRTNIALFSSARADLWHLVIKPALEAGKTVISSRNYYSTLVYQGYGEGGDLEEIKAITKTIVADERYMKPDLAIVLTLDDQKVRLSRMQERDDTSKSDFFESKPQDFQERIDQGYVKLAQDMNLAQISALVSKEEVSSQICALTDEFLAKN